MPAKLVIGKALDLDLDPAGGKWVVVCNEHSTVVNVGTRKDARSISHADFCEGDDDVLPSASQEHAPLEVLEAVLAPTVDEAPVVEVACQWFLRCDRAAVGVVKHPILGQVPTCQRCADRSEGKLVPATFTLTDEDTVTAVLAPADCPCDGTRICRNCNV